MDAHSEAYTRHEMLGTGDNDPDRGALCEHCERRIPRFADLSSDGAARIRDLIKARRPVMAVAELRALTGCPERWAWLWVEHVGQPMRRRGQRAKDSSVPEALLLDVYWAFRCEPYPTREAFVRAVREYLKDIGGETASWRPKQIVLQAGRVGVCYGANDTQETGRTFELTAENQKHFTMGELLHKIHNSVVNELRSEDHCFFEGLDLVDELWKKGVPLYELALGS